MSDGFDTGPATLSKRAQFRSPHLAFVLRQLSRSTKHNGTSLLGKNDLNIEVVATVKVIFYTL